MNVAPPIRATIEGIVTASAGHVPALGVYGEAGIGKTSLAASFPNVIFLQTEAGIPAGVEVSAFPLATSFDAVMASLASLYTAEHPYRVLVIDSITALQPLIWQETCRRGDSSGPKQAIDLFAYGRGYGLALAVWGEFLEGLGALRRDRGMTVVLIAHSTIRRFNDPESVGYDRHEFDLHEKAANLITRWLDAVLLLKRPAIVRTEDLGFNKKRARAEAGGLSPVIHTVACPAFIAKNRFNMPGIIRFEQGKGFDALAPFLPGFPQASQEKDKP